MRSVQTTFLSIVLGVAVLFGCTSKPSSDAVETQSNHPPSIRVVMLLPDPIALGEPVRLHVDGYDQDGDKITFRQQWFVNGTLVPGETGSSLPASYLSRDTRIAVEVVPSDGKNEGSPSWANQAVGNTSPVIDRISLEPNPIRIGSRIRATVDVVDADRDDIQLIYKWWRNETLIKEGSEGDLDTTGFSRKDRVVVEVTPSDRIGKGKPVFSGPVLIGNTAPQILSSPSSTMEKGHYEYAIKATDPDGDPVTFGLDTAPSGMTIDKTSGKIQWQVPSGLKGSQRVRVVVEDGQGGSAYQEFDLAPAGPVVANREGA